MDNLSYEDRLAKTNNKLLKKLFEIIITKKTNICVAVNFKTLDEVCKFVEATHEHFCVLKTQTERLEGGRLEDNLRALYDLKKKYNFLLFEDRKFCDGWETIESIYANLYVKYVDLVTVMPFGHEIFNAIHEAVKKADLPEDEPRGCLAVCEFSFANYKIENPKRCLKIAVEHSDICAGIIAQKLQISDKYNMIKATPGVHLNESSDGKNQNWRSPEVVIGDGADLLIVGRGIVAKPHDELGPAAIRYKEASYQAYLSNLNKPKARTLSSRLAACLHLSSQ